MKTLYLVIIVLIVFPIDAFSQGENDNWVFGNNAGVNFSSGSPIPMGGSSMNATLGVASISDAFGNLLFYTDGLRVWNANNQIMMNGGCCMTAGPVSEQGVVIVPHPGQPSKYFIFTTYGIVSPNSSYVNHSAAYSIIDMTAGNGLGTVISKNVPLKDASGSTNWNGYTQNVTVTQNNTGGYWVLMAHQSNLLAYEVSFSGVNTTPVTSTINQIYYNQNNSGNSTIKVSPDQTYLAITEYVDSIFSPNILIYYFDPLSGTVLTPPAYVFQYDYGIHSVEFSSQSNLIWASDFADKKIYGYDLNNISAPPVVFNINGTERPGDLQRGPDGQIYVSINNSNHLGKIKNSNDLYNAIFSQNYVYMGAYSCHYGLPQLIDIDNCIDYFWLTNVSDYPINQTIIHSASNKLFTKNYEAIPICTRPPPGPAGCSKVVLSAGNSIELLPLTFLESGEGGTIVVKIEGCLNATSKPSTPVAENIKTRVIYIPTSDDVLTGIEIYPNPVENVLNIRMPEAVKLKSAIIYDLYGRETQVSISENNTIDLSKMASGVYLLKLETNQGTMTRKVIKK